MKLAKPIVEHRSSAKSLSVYQPKSAQMEVGDGWLIKLALYKARSDETGWRTFDFNQIWLPPTDLFGGPLRLTAQPDLCRTICLLVDSFLTRQNWNKSTTLVAGTKIQLCAKFFEYCWLNGIYRLQDWPEEMWTEFLNKYKQGGWSVALDLELRSERIARNFEIEQVLDQRRSGSIGIRTEFLEALGTNAKGRELNGIRQVLMKAFHVVEEGNERPPKGSVSMSSLASLTGDLGALAEIPSPFGINSVPTDNPYRFAIQHGRPQSRTKNVSPEQLATILSKSYQWIEEFGANIVLLVSAVLKHLPKEGSSSSLLMRERVELLRRLPETKALEKKLGTSITGFERDRFDTTTTVSTLLKMTASACFILIATFNARRKDEVLDSRLGLFDGALTCISEELDLHECLFYIEKTDHDYIPFFVNEISTKAIQLMEALSRLAWAQSKSTKAKNAHEQKLFALPVVSLRKQTESWYAYDNASTYQLMTWAFGGNAPCAINAHMFRRAYAVVYNYRYDNATLLALSWQLRHRDLNMTSHYFLESSSRSHPERADRIWAVNEKARKAQIAHSKELVEEIGIVGEDRLRQFVEEVIVGSRNFSGGFAKLVARFHHKLGKRLEFDKLSLQQQAKSLSGILIARGHKPVPFWHGDCNSGPVKASAKCFSAKEGVLQKHRASPDVCNQCAYHSCTMTHLLAMKKEAADMFSSLKQVPGGLRYQALKNDLDGLERAIILHERRLKK